MEETECSFLLFYNRSSVSSEHKSVLTHCSSKQSHLNLLKSTKKSLQQSGLIIPFLNKMHWGCFETIVRQYWEATKNKTLIRFSLLDDHNHSTLLHFFPRLINYLWKCLDFLRILIKVVISRLSHRLFLCIKKKFGSNFSPQVYTLCILITLDFSWGKGKCIWNKTSRKYSTNLQGQTGKSPDLSLFSQNVSGPDIWLI